MKKSKKQKAAPPAAPSPVTALPAAAPDLRADRPAGQLISWRKVALFIAICWLPFFVYTMPGNIAWDTGAGIGQFMKIGAENPNNPYFQNYLMGAFCYFGRLAGNTNLMVLLYCLLQTVAEILVLSRIIARVGEHSRVAGYILLAFYCFVPTVPIYAMTMGKDSNLAVAVLLYLACALQAMRDDAYWKEERHETLFASSILLMTLFRNHAGWVPAVAFVLYTIFAVRQKRLVLHSLAVLGAVAMLSVGLPALLDIPKVEIKESLTVPMQTMAYFIKTRPEDLTDEERGIITQVIDIDRMMRHYDPNIVDSMKKRMVLDEKTTGPFLRLWLRKCFQHPLTMLQGMYQSTYIYLIPTERSANKGQATVGYDISEEVKEKMNMYNDNPNVVRIKNYLKRWINAPVLGLLVRIGLFSWLLALLVILIFVFRRPRYLLCAAPLLTIFIGCLLSPLNGYYRYALSMIVGVPVVLADLLSTVTANLRFPPIRRRVRNTSPAGR